MGYNHHSCDRRQGDKESIVEKPDPADAPSDLGIVGAYALTPDIFEAIEKTAPGKNGEVQLTDAARASSSRSAPSTPSNSTGAASTSAPSRTGCGQT